MAVTAVMAGSVHATRQCVVHGLVKSSCFGAIRLAIYEVHSCWVSVGRSIYERTCILPRTIDQLHSASVQLVGQNKGVWPSVS